MKESSPIRTRGKSISFRGRVGAEEPVGLLDYECVCTHVLSCYVIGSLRNPWCEGLIWNTVTWLSDKIFNVGGMWDKSAALRGNPSLTGLGKIIKQEDHSKINNIALKTKILYTGDTMGQCSKN